MFDCVGRRVRVAAQQLDLGPDTLARGARAEQVAAVAVGADAREVVVGGLHVAARREAEPTGLDDRLHERDVAPDVRGLTLADVEVGERVDRDARAVGRVRRARGTTS